MIFFKLKIMIITLNYWNKYEYAGHEVWFTLAWMCRLCLDFILRNVYMLDKQLCCDELRRLSIRIQTLNTSNAKPNEWQREGECVSEWGTVKVKWWTEEKEEIQAIRFIIGKNDCVRFIVFMLCVIFFVCSSTLRTFPTDRQKWKRSTTQSGTNVDYLVVCYYAK